MKVYAYICKPTKPYTIMEEKTEREIRSMLAKHGISMTEVAAWFGYKNYASFAASTARERVLRGLLKFYERIEK